MPPLISLPVKIPASLETAKFLTNHIVCLHWDPHGHRQGSQAPVPLTGLEKVFQGPRHLMGSLPWLSSPMQCAV